MKTRRLIVMLILLLASFAWNIPRNTAHAQSQPQSDGIKIYGQTLRPDLLKLPGTDYTWDDLKDLTPKLLPNAEKYELNAKQVCDRLYDLTDQYLEESEKRTNWLIYKMEFVVNEGKVEPPADLALTDRLAEKSPAAMDELIKLLPDETEKLKQARNLTLASFAMMYLRDAALVNCPTHAKAKEYTSFAVPAQ